MNCDVIRGQFSSLIDGELTAQDNDRVAQHLSDCEGCRAELRTLRRLDVRLQSLAVPQALESRIMVAVTAEAAEPTNTLPPPLQYRKRIVAAVIGMAAVIGLLAVWLRPLRQAPGDQAPGVQAPWVAVVVRSIGNVQVMAPDGDAWSDVGGASMPLVSGSRVKTPERGSCEVETAEDAQLRLDADTELVVHSASHMQVLRGQVWCQASPQQSLTFDTPVREDAAPLRDVFSCPKATELQVRVDPQQAVVVGTEPERKVWQLPLLALRGSDDSELSSLVETLLANVGHSKMQFMDEAQIRALGPRGAIPLLMYVQNGGSLKQPAVRQRAMQIAAELADDSAFELLAELAGDSEPAIRQQAQAAIDRLGHGEF